MALTFPSLLTSAKFLCKYLRIYPPSTVICYTHSHVQLAVQPCNAQKPCNIWFCKESKPKLKTTSGKNTEDVQGHLQFPCIQKEKAYLLKSKSYQAVNAVWQNIGTLEIHQKTMDESLLKKWNHDLLMDHKQLVLMVFEQDRIAGGPFFNHKNTLPNSSLQKKKTLPRVPAKEVKIEQTKSSYTHKSLIAVQQALKQHQQVCQISRSSFLLNDSISETAMLFADLPNDNKMPKKKKEFKTGPDATQLSSVLLDLRDEIPEFFLKKPNYTIYHPRVKFVNNITGTTTNGIYPYRAQISGMRLMILSCMTELSVEVLKITKHPKEGTIKARWRIKGIPMIRKLVPHIARRVKASEDGYRYLDGFSVFEIGSDGLIHCHRLHKVMPSSSPEKENALWMMFLLPFIHLLDPRSCETFGAFECRSTDRDIEPVAAESANTLAHLL